MLDALTVDYAQVLATGLTYGAIFGVVALGYHLIYVSSGMLNFALGEQLAIAGLVVLSLQSAGVPLVLAIALVTLVLMPFVLGGLTIVGFADTWLDFRRRVTPDELRRQAHIQQVTYRKLANDQAVREAVLPRLSTELRVIAETNLTANMKLRALIKEQKGNVKMALLVYNRGPVAVAAARASGNNPSNGYDNAVTRGYKGSGVVD